MGEGKCRLEDMEGAVEGVQTWQKLMWKSIEGEECFTKTLGCARILERIS